MGPRRLRSLLVAIVVVSAGCRLVDGPASVPPIGSPGTSAAPREVNLIARDYVFEPAELRLVPGESVLIHVVNAGLDLHEAVIGGPDVQAAWESAEAAASGAPPGRTPEASVAPGLAGLRVVVGSGQRVDVTYVVPPAAGPGLIVGCHLPGHFARGMAIPVRLVQPGS
ncbi:MAG TPA: hypothetical protein VH720_10300 [Candidatus Limnocylindrales bacterium]|jgi:hypothetical protein